MNKDKVAAIAKDPEAALVIICMLMETIKELEEKIKNSEKVS